MATERMRRVNEVIREVIGDAISTELDDPRIGFVTVTAVDTSPDLRSARVFVSVLGDSDEREAHARGPGRLARPAPGGGSRAEMRMKHTPTLTFHYDDGPERGVRVAHLLDE